MAVDIHCPNCWENLGKDVENPNPAYCGNCMTGDIRNDRGYIPQAENELEEYQVLSPDGFPIEREKTYKNMSEVQIAIEKFVQKYESQGYYSLSNRTRLPLDQIENNCKIVTLHE